MGVSLLRNFQQPEIRFTFANQGSLDTRQPLFSSHIAPASHMQMIAESLQVTVSKKKQTVLA